MSELDKVALVRSLYASDFDPERLGEFLADDCIYHGPDGTVEGIESLRAMCAELHRAFPDLRFSVEAIRVEGEEVEVHWTLRGTHEGALGGMEPTGRPVEMTGRHTEVVRSGKIVERFGASDHESLAEQLEGAEEGLEGPAEENDAGPDGEEGGAEGR